LNYLQLDERNKENLKQLHDLTYTASPAHLRSYHRHSDQRQKGTYLTRHVGSKTFGGRCYNNRMLNYATAAYYSLCDIDISSAYTTAASVLDYYFGNPVILNFDKLKVSLRQFLDYYKKHLIKRGYKLVVETNPKKPLNIEQDIFPSWHKDSVKINNSIVSDKGKQYILSSVNLENTPTSIYTTELSNTPLSWDDIDLIMTELSKDQREEILDNTYLITSIFYPKSFQCQKVEELKFKIKKHENSGNGKFKDAMNHASIDNENFEVSHYWHSVNFGQLIMFNIMQLRQQNKKVNPSLSYLYKLIGNTIYGVNVSPYFTNSNIVLAGNITAMCRCGMWYSEKALNICQTITDGGIFFLNEVLHLIRNKIDTTFNRTNKWRIKPITKDGKKIDYYQGVGWLIDGEYYGCDRELLAQTAKDYETLKNKIDKNHPELLAKKEQLDTLEKSISKLLQKINDLAAKHISKVFPNNDVFNGKFMKVKVDENGLGRKDENNQYILEEITGLFKFEVKNLCDKASFHGSADYLYENIYGCIVKKMRGYEAKKEIIAWDLNEEGVLVPKINHYKDISPVEKFLKDIRENPNSVYLPLPYTKNSILKTAEYSNNFKKTYQY
jgi:hypothetical protein